MRRRRTAIMMAAGGVGVALALRARSARLHPVGMAGKTVLITGGSRGLGLALAREFADHGARIALCARDGAPLEWAREDLRQQGAEAFIAVCDVADREAVERVVADVTAHFGAIDVLVNNAGIIQVGPVHDMTLRDFEDAMAVNFWGMVHATFAVLPEMRRRGRGTIVNVTSIGGKVSVPRLLPYTAAKFAAVGFSEGLSAELAGSGIRIVTIVPGLMRTGSYLHALFKGDPETESQWFALGSTLPGISMATPRAARQIVGAVARGQTERVLSIPAVILARLHGLAPAAVIRLMGLSNRLLLPTPASRGREPIPAIAIEERWPAWIHGLTVLGKRAAREFHQRPEDRRRTGEAA